MTFKLRDYQVEAVKSIFTYFETHKTGNPLVAMPTGSGKALVIAAFLKQVLSQFPNQKIMVLTHVKELIEQNHDKMMTLWPTAPVGIYSAGLKRRDINNPILFAGIASVVKNPGQFGYVDILLVDEAHLISPKKSTMYQKFIDALKVTNPYIRAIGLTATPWRLGHGRITDDHLFTDTCFDITDLKSFNRLIDLGYLCPLIPKATKTVLNTGNVHMRGGEFIPKELQHAVDKYEITLAAIKEAIQVGHDRKCWLVFTTGIEHTEHTAEILDELGISCAVVHSGNKEYPMTNAKRDAAIDYLRRGKIQALVNANVLTTGFDLDRIDMVVMLRPTASTVLWIQALGRSTRPLYAPGYDIGTYQGRIDAIKAGGKPNALIMDFAGNTARLGPINDPVIPQRKGSKGGGTAPIKLCPECDTYNHSGVKFCIACDFEFKFKTKLQITSSTAELIRKDNTEKEELAEVIIKEFAVDHITYNKHSKKGKPSSLKVSYYSGLQMFNEYICIEHANFAGIKARQWWGARSNLPVPKNTKDMLDQIEHLKVPKSLSVWVNKKYPEITKHIF